MQQALEDLELDVSAPATPLGQLRFLTCGSVDDGKSTLIGRLLYDTSLILDDQLLQLQQDSRRHGTAGDGIDFALLVDGLEAERQQGITIDVAYRYFATPRRRFIVADTPGHEQYTRNMATGASAADLAVLLIDARRGVLTQTRRHAFIASLMGIRYLVLAINKMDLVDWSEQRFQAIVADFRSTAADLGFHSIQPIPLSARHGDNVIEPSAGTPWYAGPSLLHYLETVDVEDAATVGPFRMPVQSVVRPDADFRGYAGTLAAGCVRPGDAIAAYPSGRTARVQRIVTMDGDLQDAEAGAAVTIVLDRQIDIARGDVLAAADAPACVAQAFSAHLIWLSDTPMTPGRGYLIKLGAKLVGGTIGRLRHRINVDTRERQSAEQLALNDVGAVDLSLQSPVAFEPFAASRDLGGFIVIDRQTSATIGVGMIDAGLSPGREAVWHAMQVDRQARARLNRQRPGVVWFTGLSGSGKSTIANLVERRLHAEGRHTYLLDGDNLRHGLNADLGFSPEDRAENIRRIGEVAAIMADAGLIVLVSAISPYKADRDRARLAAGEDSFMELFVDAPVEECRRRDPKGLYRKADAGLISGFTGIDAPYERPDNPALKLRTENAEAEDLAESVVAALYERGWIT